VTCAKSLRQLAVCVCVLVGSAGMGARALASDSRPSTDPGLVLELDRARYEILARDVRSGDVGPRFRVVLGSPAHDTPDGEYPVYQVILNPAWRPSDDALAAGAQKLPPSLEGPMGVAKIPFADAGTIALHGGGDALLLGKPVSGGCVRARDADLLRVIAWLDERGTLGPPRVSNGGEIQRAFRRPVRIRVR
jgi:hypothetical protein